ncbi:endothelin-converting enzyme homolog, partial [Paramuricea clavata]
MVVNYFSDIINKLDESTNPCDDFYQYSCGGFLKKTHIPDDKTQVTSSAVADNFVKYALRDLLQNEQLMSNYSKDSAVYKTFTYYKSCMNESAIENAGIKPVLDVIEQHGSWNITNKNWSKDSWILEKILARLFVDLNTPAFIGLDIASSYFNTSERFITISGGRSGNNSIELDKEQSRSRVPRLKEE